MSWAEIFIHSFFKVNGCIMLCHLQVVSLEQVCENTVHLDVFGCTINGSAYNAACIYSERNWIYIICFSPTVLSHRNGNGKFPFVCNLFFICSWFCGLGWENIFYTCSSVTFLFKAFFFFACFTFLALCKELLELHLFEICLLILAYFILFLFFLSFFFFCFLGCFPKGGQSG